MKPWWELYPGRLEFEIEQLEALGAEIRRVDRNEAKGTVRLEFSFPYQHEKLGLVALFPIFYPLARFEVLAPHLNINRHWNPFGQNLCLLPRGPENWNVELYVAKVLQDKLRKIFETQDLQQSPEPGIEEPQGEPISALLPYANDSIFLVSSDWNIPADELEGEGTIGVLDRNGALFRAVVLEVRGKNNRVLARSHERLARLVSDRHTFAWKRVAEPVVSNTAKQFLTNNGLRSGPLFRLDTVDFRLSAALVTEEVEYRIKGDSWLFIVEFQNDQQKGFRKGYVPTNAYYARAARFGTSDITVRSPFNRDLANKTVVVVGAGCLGAHSIIELARTGVGHLKIADFDLVEPATTIRWPLGLAGSGKMKVEVLSQFLKTNYPLTNIDKLGKKIGSPEEFFGADAEEIEQFIYGADLIFDASVDDAANDILAELAAESGKPYLSISATPGAFGGRVVMIEKNPEPCWDCWLLTRTDRPGDLVPPADHLHSSF